MKAPWRTSGVAWKKLFYRRKRLAVRWNKFEQEKKDPQKCARCAENPKNKRRTGPNQAAYLARFAAVVELSAAEHGGRRHSANEARLGLARERNEGMLVWYRHPGGAINYASLSQRRKTISRKRKKEERNTIPTSCGGDLSFVESTHRTLP